MKMRTWQDLNNVYLEKFDRLFDLISDYYDRFGEYPETIQQGYRVASIDHPEKEIWVEAHTGSYTFRICREFLNLAAMEYAIHKIDEYFNGYVGFLKQQEEETKEVDVLSQKLESIKL